MEFEKAASIVRKVIVAETGHEESTIKNTDLLLGKFDIDDLGLTDLIEGIVVMVRDEGHGDFEIPDPSFDDYDFRTATVGDVVNVLALIPLRPIHSPSEAGNEVVNRALQAA